MDTLIKIADSACQKATGATTNTVTGGVQLDSGYLTSTAQSRGGLDTAINNALHLGADINGVVDSIVLAVTPIDANADVFGTLSWREII